MFPYVRKLMQRTTFIDTNNSKHHALPGVGNAEKVEASIKGEAAKEGQSIHGCEKSASVPSWHSGAAGGTKVPEHHWKSDTGSPVPQDGSGDCFEGEGGSPFFPDGY